MMVLTEKGAVHCVLTLTVSARAALYYTMAHRGASRHVAARGGTLQRSRYLLSIRLKLLSIRRRDPAHRSATAGARNPRLPVRELLVVLQQRLAQGSLHHLDGHKG